MKERLLKIAAALEAAAMDNDSDVSWFAQNAMLEAVEEIREIANEVDQRIMNHCRHKYFLASFPSNELAIERHVSGDWIVRCGHCGLGLAGSSGRGGGRTEIIWQQAPGTWFGSFGIR
jgi:hypothetical protein